MIYKAIIEEIIDQYTYKIRIPVIHRVSISSVNTSSDNLPVACICAPPGTYIYFEPGDVVIVLLENNDESKPIIIGQLYRSAITDSLISISAQNLDVENSANLPKNTNIGNLTAQQLSYLETVRSDIQKQIDMLAERVETIEKIKSENLDSIDKAIF